ETLLERRGLIPLSVELLERWGSNFGVCCGEECTLQRWCEPRFWRKMVSTFSKANKHWETYFATNVCVIAKVDPGNDGCGRVVRRAVNSMQDTIGAIDQPIFSVHIVCDHVASGQFEHQFLR